MIWVVGGKKSEKHFTLYGKTFREIVGWSYLQGVNVHEVTTKWYKFNIFAMLSVCTRILIPYVYNKICQSENYL